MHGSVEVNNFSGEELTRGKILRIQWLEDRSSPVIAFLDTTKKSDRGERTQSSSRAVHRSRTAVIRHAV
jgi:hypothetical protein